jgi:dTDP-4-amino-4,6-dideoxygalactose transaminase
MDQSAKRMYTNNRAWTYDVPGQGFRYHLANLHAAIGLTQLAKIDEFIDSRRRACRHYNAVLFGVEGLIVPQTDFQDVAPFLYYVRVLDGHRETLIDELKAAGIDTGIHWIPGHRFSFLKTARRGDLSVTDRIGSEILTLPLHSYMDLDTVDQVATAVRDSLRRLRRSSAAA